jgi:predicted transcriptional regulator
VSNNPRFSDYDLSDVPDVTAMAQLRAPADPLRNAILELLLERAATVSEVAAALGCPNSTVAHYVSVLVSARCPAAESRADPPGAGH